MRLRIRTIKPEFFLHEKLYDLERETGLPIRVAFAGLWCCADREGRFEWRPRTLKSCVLPYDDVDFSRVLDALATRGFLVKYAWEDGSEREEYGCIPSFVDHQAINNREPPSSLPAPPEKEVKSTPSTREIRVDDASATREHISRVEGNGKGREGKGTGKEGYADADASRAPSVELALSSKRGPTPGSVVWDSYADAYERRYKVRPVRNAKTSSQAKQLVARLGADEAPMVVQAYVSSNNAFYVRLGHSLGGLLQDAEKMRTEAVTRRISTSSGAQRLDRDTDKIEKYRELLDWAREQDESERALANG